MPQDSSQTEPPLCTQCRGELYEEDNTLPRRLVAAFLLVVAGALAVYGRPETGPRTTGITAAVLLALWLIPPSIQWRCAACGKTFRRQRPPRGETNGKQEIDGTTEDVGQHS